MNLALSPKTLFQQQEDHRTAFRGMAHSDAFRQALSAAMSEYCYNGKPTTEQMVGAKTFVTVLLNLSEPASPPRKLPAKSLSYDQPETVKA